MLGEARGRGLIDADVLAMLEGVLQVSEMQVRDVMVPRSQMVVVHGTLHPLGYDHGAPRQARVMERLEAGILAGLGHPDPYRTQDGSHA